MAPVLCLYGKKIFFDTSQTSTHPEIWDFDVGYVIILPYLDTISKQSIGLGCQKLALICGSDKINDDIAGAS